MLTWLAGATAAHPERAFWGHGSNGSEATFVFGLAKYLLVAASQRDGYFLSNGGYQIDQGLLQPHWQYEYAGDSFTLGEPLGNFTRAPAAQWTLQREFSGGTVEVGEGKEGWRGTGSTV